MFFIILCFFFDKFECYFGGCYINVNVVNIKVSDICISIKVFMYYEQLVYNYIFDVGVIFEFVVQVQVGLGKDFKEVDLRSELLLVFYDKFQSDRCGGLEGIQQYQEVFLVSVCYFVDIKW